MFQAIELHQKTILNLVDNVVSERERELKQKNDDLKERIGRLERAKAAEAANGPPAIPHRPRSEEEEGISGRRRRAHSSDSSEERPHPLDPLGRFGAPGYLPSLAPPGVPVPPMGVPPLPPAHPLSGAHPLSRVHPLVRAQSLAAGVGVNPYYEPPEPYPYYWWGPFGYPPLAPFGQMAPLVNN